jgi:hypothetical protein
MMAGSILCFQWFSNVGPSTMAVLHYLCMMFGMCVGMLVPHMLEYLAPNVEAKQNSDQSKTVRNPLGKDLTS